MILLYSVFCLSGKIHPREAQMSSYNPAVSIKAQLARHNSSRGRTLLLTGPWGSGKTYLWKAILSKELNRQTIYISAFGAENAGQLRARLLTNMLLSMASRGLGLDNLVQEKSRTLRKLVDFFGRSGKAASSALNSVGAAMLRKVEIDPLELTHLLRQDTVICIDDIERISPHFPIQDLLGTANILSEHQGFDLVLICNEEQIIDRAGYNLFKEKIVFATFQLSIELKEVFDRLLESFVDESKVHDEISKHKATILEVFASASSTNLRLLNRVFSHLESIFGVGLVPITPEQVRFLVALTIDFSLRQRESKFYEFSDYVVRISDGLDKHKRTAEPKTAARLEFLQTYFGKADYAYDSGLFRLVSTGQIDIAELRSPRATGPQKTLSQQKLELIARAWRFASDEQINEFIQDLIQALETDRGLAASDVLLFLAFARFLGGIRGISLPDSAANAAATTLRTRALEQTDEVDEMQLEMGIGGLGRHVDVEKRAFLLSVSESLRSRMAELLREHLAEGRTSDLVWMVTRSPEALKTLLDAVTLDPVFAKRTRASEMFYRTIQTVVEALLKSRGEWPEGTTHLKSLRVRLSVIATDVSEGTMERFRANELLAKFPDDGENVTV